MLYSVNYKRWDSKFQLKNKKWVFIPSRKSIWHGRIIKKRIEEKWKPPPYYYHLTNGGHVKAIKLHKENQYFFNIDIADFYSSINKSRITRSLKTLFSYDYARNMAQLSSVISPDDKKRHIVPFGFVQSPIVASICLFNSGFGKHLDVLYKDKQFQLSVYVDDIIVSCNNLNILELCFNELKSSLVKSRFKVNEDKTTAPNSTISVFNILLSNSQTEIIPNRFQELYHNYKNTSNESVKLGIAGYVSTVNKKQVVDLNR